jgi:hypothetical protein
LTFKTEGVTESCSESEVLLKSDEMTGTLNGDLHTFMIGTVAAFITSVASVPMVTVVTKITIDVLVTMLPLLPIFLWLPLLAWLSGVRQCDECASRKEKPIVVK